jgi:4-diphosphocytidyl-2-C-methyl-D-erythritol kinase
MRLRALAPAKINVALFLGPVREDGRHELVTVFESISLADDLVMETLEGGGPRGGRGGDRRGADAVSCPGVAEPNLVTRALSALRARGWDGPPVRIEVAKRIPVAAGLGGGSADAAAALRLAVELAPGRPEEVMDVAASLGADVPSQIVPGLSVGTGAGEIVEPFGPLAPHGVLILPADVELPTPDVYREADRLGLARAPGFLRQRYERLVSELERGSARLSRELIVNDLEPAAISLCPSIAPALGAARDAGAEEAFVCGSGPTVAGLFWGADGAERAAVAARSLRDRFAGAVAASPIGAEFGLPVFA